MEATNLNWETEFVTADDLMIHTFSERVQVVTNIKTGEIKTIRDGEVIDKRNDLAISEYERFLLNVAVDSAKLNYFKNEGRLK